MPFGLRSGKVEVLVSACESLDVSDPDPHNCRNSGRGYLVGKCCGDGLVPAAKERPVVTVDPGAENFGFSQPQFKWAQAALAGSWPFAWPGLSYVSHGS